MPNLTLSQQFALAKTARELARLNRSKSQFQRKSVKVSAVKPTGVRLAGKGSACQTALVPDKRKQPSAAKPSEEQGCPKCHRCYPADKLKKHMTSCIGPPPLPKPPIAGTKAEAAANVYPICKGPVDDAKLAPHLEFEHKSVMCDLCQKPIKLIDVKEHQLGHTGWATYTPCKIPTDRSSFVGPSSSGGGHYDPSSGARIFQGGLCGKK
jgi:hypothetical protein